MAKFRFAQEKQVTTWVRDFYNVEAESLEEAIEIVRQGGKCMESLECDDSRVTYDERDADNSYQWLTEDADNGYPSNYAIICCDTDDEIVSNY
jgi:hypothetical protein